MTTPAAARTDDHGQRFYPIPNPATGETIELPNCSSVIDILASFNIPTWRTKMAMLGVAFRDDLRARVIAAHHLEAGPKRNGPLRMLADECIDAGQIVEPGKGFLANDFGTAIHLMAEQIDAGVVDVVNLPATVKEHCAGYLATIEGHGLDVVVSEATVYHHNVDVMGERYGYAATLDRIVRFQRTAGNAACFDRWDLGRGCFVVDLKTGTVHEKAAMQLASHVNAEGIYDAATGQHLPLPEDLRRDVGFVLQLTKDGAKLIPLDLAGSNAWPAFAGALPVLAFSKTNPLGPPLEAPAATIAEVPATSAAATGTAAVAAPEGTVPPAVPSTPRAADDGLPPPSSAAEPPSATEDRIPPAPPTAAGSSAAEAPSQVDDLMDALAKSVDAAKAARQANEAANEGGGSERVTVTPPDPDPTPSAAEASSWDAMPHVNGERFTCSCGGNVFRTRDEITYRCNSCGLLFEGTAPSADPVHISSPVAELETQIAERAAKLLFDKHAWLLDRMHRYDDRGRQVLAGYWPAGVAPLKHGIPHTLAELELLTVAVNKTDAELGLPFPDTTDPSDRQWNEAPAAEVAAIVERLKALPRDLLTDVTTKLAGTGVPKLTDPASTIYLAHLDAVEEHLALAEADAKPRLAALATLTELAAGNGITQEQLLAVVGHSHVLEVTETEAELLCDVIDACGLQVVAFQDGVLVPGPQAFAGMKPSEILAAGRAAAKAIDHPAPRSAADAKAAPLLAAVHAVRGTDLDL